MKTRSEELWKSAVRLVLHPWRLAAVLLLLTLFLTASYRAATQSISHDEGMLFETALAGSWSQVLNFDYGNHHVLTDLFSKLTITLFGLSAFTMRIPSLLGCLLYFYAVFRISAFLFGESYLFLLSTALLSLNPFVLDYFSCARGYGLALGLFFFALYYSILYLAQSSERRRSNSASRLLNIAGVALGLSIGSNPIMIFPVGALLAAFVPMIAGDTLIRRPEMVAVAAVREKPRNARQERRRKSRREASVQAGQSIWKQISLHFVLPAVAVGGFISMLPNRLIQPGVEYLGPASLFAILRGLVGNSLLHSANGYRGLIAWLPANAVMGVVTYVVVPGGLVVLILIAARTLTSWIGKRDWDAVPLINRFLMLLGGMLPVATILVVVSRYVFGQAYPELRTAMYWLPLLTLGGLGLLRWLGQRSGPERILAVPVAVFLGLCALQFVTQFNTRYFAEWSYCAAVKDMVQMVRADRGGQPGSQIRVGATWQLEPVINFYRAAWHLDWMDPVYRESPDNSYDFYLLAFDDTALVEKLHLKTLLSDRLSGTVLAKRTNI